MHRLLLLIVLCFTVLSCGSKKVVTTKKRQHRTKTEDVATTRKTKPQEETVVDTPEVYANSTEEYIAIYSDIAKEEMRLYHIPASITLAQGILESGSGKGRLSVEANNHFGIKCHDWTGAKIYHDDDASQECFRKYNNSKYSFRDHSLFLSKRKRYHKLFALDKDDYEGWAKELKAAGYATDRKYPNKLISLIERYQLYRFDAEVLGKNAQANDKHVVKNGDTLYAISKKYKIPIEEIQSLNGLDTNEIHVGQVLYIKPLPKDY
jgi:flagellum-specific peptidoglycan hydrolase FlgJ